MLDLAPGVVSQQKPSEALFPIVLLLGVVPRAYSQPALPSCWKEERKGWGREDERPTPRRLWDRDRGEPRSRRGGDPVPSG